MIKLKKLLVIIFDLFDYKILIFVRFKNYRTDIGE